jgi:hypothetical protein
MGLEGCVGLAPADIKQIAANPDFPALYQLLPAPGIAAVWDTKGAAVTQLDLYDPNVAIALGLDGVNLKKASDTYAILIKNNRPKHVKYIYLAGSGSDTWLRVDLSGHRPDARKGKEAGDGTVPLWSAIDPQSAHHVAPAVHDAVFKNEQIRMLIYRFLGARPPAIAFASTGGKPLVSIFPAQTIYALNAAVELMMTPTITATRLEGDLFIEHSEGGDKPIFMPFARQPLKYDGIKIERLSLRLDPPGKSGFFKVTFEGSHETATDGAAMFGVSEAGGGSGG